MKAIVCMKYGSPDTLQLKEAGGRTSKSIETLVLQALAFQAAGTTTQAIEALERALTLAEPGGFVRIFVDEGPPMERLLRAAATRGMVPDYTAKLLAAFQTTDRKRRQDSADAHRRAPWSVVCGP